MRLEVAALSSPASSAPGGRLGRATLDRLTQRLADLRQLDDEFGGAVLCDLAAAELRWLTGLVESADHDGREERELLGLVAEAARLCGWLHFDAGRHAAAQACYVTALRCSAGAADPWMGANILAGMISPHGHHGYSTTLLPRSGQCVRDRSVYHARSAQASCHAHELELACEELTTAALLAQRTGSIHSLDTIRHARRTMSDHENERVVREFDRTLAIVVGEVTKGAAAHKPA